MVVDGGRDGSELGEWRGVREFGGEGFAQIPTPAVFRELADFGHCLFRLCFGVVGFNTGVFPPPYWGIIDCITNWP